MTSLPYNIEPKLDLKFEREVDLTPEQLWAAWTQAEHVVHWFTPAPWKTIDCEIDLRPGGMFKTVMLSPEGERYPNIGCFLEVVPNRRLVWTNSVGPGFRPAPPQPNDAFFFSASIHIEPLAQGSRYATVVVHGDEAACHRHAMMGFQEGWSKALDQLITYMKARD